VEINEHRAALALSNAALQNSISDAASLHTNIGIAPALLALGTCRLTIIPSQYLL
jgi:hypothetical protein